MIKAIFTAIILTCGIVNAQSVDKPPVEWKPMAQMDDGILYIDKKSITTTQMKSGRQYSSVDLLMSYDKPTVITTSKKEFVIRSSVHTIVVDCDTGLTAPVIDFYFKEPIPTRKSIPLGGETYPLDTNQYIVTANKKSILYSAVCRNFI